MPSSETPREFDLVVFDNDGTLNTLTSCWKYIHTAFGTYEPDGRRLLKEHLTLRTPYDEYARLNLVLWKGRHRGEFLDIINSVPLRDGTVEVIRYLRDRGYLLGVISSGFTFWRDRFHDEFDIDFDFFRANEIVFDNSGICTGEIIMKTTDNVPGKDKASIITSEAGKLNIPLSRTVMIGDGWGDVGAMRLVGRSYCVGENFPEVRAAADEWLGGSLMPLMERL